MLEIQFGEGGADSKLFVHDLSEAYLKYASRNGIACQVLDISEGHVSIKLIGKGVWKLFKQEAGKHVVQRVPPTEHRGRRQTSVVVVGVLPLPPESSIQPLREQDIETITQTGKQHAGGQNVNKVASAVRMKHLPTGIAVFINGRDQIWNRKEARRILTAKVNDLRNNHASEGYSSLRQQQLGNSGRGDKIRTYNYIESRAVDHRSGCKTTNVDGVIRKGMFELLI